MIYSYLYIGIIHNTPPEAYLKEKRKEREKREREKKKEIGTLSSVF